MRSIRIWGLRGEKNGFGPGPHFWHAFCLKKRGDEIIKRRAPNYQIGDY